MLGPPALEKGKTMLKLPLNRIALCRTAGLALVTALFATGAAAAPVTPAADPASIPGIAPLTATDCSAMQAAKVISERNPLPCLRLARVRFPYIDFEGHQRQDGEMIVMDALAPYVLRTFMQLHAMKFPLHSARSLGYYAGDDAASMADNNSSAFNGRPITGGSSWSIHAYGAAIDINPLQNPYLSRDADGKLTVLPASSATRYTDRSTLHAGMAETLSATFATNGFLTWGGNWHQPIDYQHFEIGDRAFVEKLARSTPEQAAGLFDNYVRTYRNCVLLRPENTDASRQTQCAQKTIRNAD
jgi:hypothetical protein